MGESTWFQLSGPLRHTDSSSEKDSALQATPVLSPKYHEQQVIGALRSSRGLPASPQPEPKQREPGEGFSLDLHSQPSNWYTRVIQ